MGFNGIYPLVICDIAIEHGDLEWIFPLNMVIFSSYVTNDQRVSQMLHGAGMLSNFHPNNITQFLFM